MIPKRHVALVIGIAVLSGVLSSAAQAQLAKQVGVQLIGADTFNPRLRLPIPNPHVYSQKATGSTFTLSGESPSLGRHVLIGAMIGVAAGAVVSLIMFAQDPIDPTLIVDMPIAVGAGAAAGALAGFLVYLTRR